MCDGNLRASQMDFFPAILSRLNIRRAFACLIVAFISHADVAIAQNVNQNSGGGCSPNITAGGNVTVVCPNNTGPPSSSPSPSTSPGGPGGRWRFGEFIPTCPFGKGYSLEHRQCIPSQYIGGIIPCSADDRSFINGQYVPNCR
jgi:hypothetical protein